MKFLPWLIVNISKDKVEDISKLQEIGFYQPFPDKGENRVILRYDITMESIDNPKLAGILRLLSPRLRNNVKKMYDKYICSLCCKKVELSKRLQDGTFIAVPYNSNLYLDKDAHEEFSVAKDILVKNLIDKIRSNPSIINDILPGAKGLVSRNDMIDLYLKKG